MIQWHRGFSFLRRRRETNRFPPPGKLFVFAGNPLGSEGTKQLPRRGGVSKLTRCEASSLHHPEIECPIMPSIPARKPPAPALLEPSLPAALFHLCWRLYGHATQRQHERLVASSETPGSHG